VPAAPSAAPAPSAPAAATAIGAAPAATAPTAPSAPATATGADTETATATATAPAEPTAAPPPPRGIHVIVVTDIDCLFSDFFMLQQQGENPDRELNLRLDNVPFVLNVLDVLAGDERFVEIRKRRRVHRTLSKLEEQNEKAVEQAMNERDRANSEFRAALAAEEAKIKAEEERLRSLTGVKDEDKAQRLAWAAVDGQRRLEVTRSQLERKLEKQTKDIEQDLVRQTRQVQNKVKTFALFAPLWLPLIVGVIEFFKRRSAEYEGVSKQRLR
jgi:ABC-2 type transport system permease protein